MQDQLELFPDLPVQRDPSTYYQRYQAHMRSAQWRTIADKTKMLAGYRCQVQQIGCLVDRSLEAHHKHYLTVFRERPGIDTQCVCSNCHRLIHRRAANDNLDYSATAAGMRQSR